VCGALLAWVSGAESRGFDTREDVVTLEIAIDREVCMGSGNCSFWAPGVFDLDDDGVAVVIDPEGAPEDKIILAAQGCPTQAISLIKDGQKLV
jgi:ferredoxin